ncbi:putative DHS-like NAD FAD-binding domain-containing protein [Lyophyllum shimeji]|uniref:DHS-like NAD FAD-binding domain-containing protein n=1 Tax=Lyophyllum shimeji TaxID=47721 RepID=A0A9P3UIR5_LYOSH|nr:putative DHS-like NAD FAD-binding domain-containing protein [Lyophyllum shimeji]
MTVTLKLDEITDSHTRRALEAVSLSVAKSKKIVVITGAGISCSSGIPDFRSSDGLYALVKQQYPDVVLKGRDLFDASLFRDATSTAVFYTFISKLKQSIDSASPTPTHRFIKTLDAKKKLLRSYTQNIDGLEERVGLLGSSSQDVKSDGKGKSKIKRKDVRNVQLHGDIHSVRCMSCSAEYPCTSHHLGMFLEGTPPNCPECVARLKARVARSARPVRIGALRPAIVLYDEPHPLGDEIGAIQSADVSRKPDMLIIMGTSLKVHGLRKMVKDFAKTVHSTASSSSSSTVQPSPGRVIFVNKTPPSSEWSGIIDCHIQGETDAWAEKVIEDWKRMRPADWEVQQMLVASDGDVSTSGPFKAVKGVATPKGKGKAPKNSLPGEENIPPPFDGMVLSTPDNAEHKTAAKGPPLSPSKRTQTTSHYNDIESSPSKRRVLPFKGALADDERKQLFTESTNNQPAIDSDDIFDLAMQDVEVKLETRATKPGTRKIKAAKARAAKGPSKPKQTLAPVVGKISGRPPRSR